MTATIERATLPDFEEMEVTGSAVKVTNAGDGLSDAMTIGKKALHLGDVVYYLLRGEVTQINHRSGKGDDVTRVHTVKANQITEVDGVLASQMLATAAEALQKRKDEIEGQLRFDAENEAADREQRDETDDAGTIAADAAERAKN